MKYSEFKNKIRNFPIFSSSHISSLSESPQILRNQLTLWQRQGLILKLRKGLYILNESDRKINPSRLFIANQLLSPSYVSTEHALFFYGLIPERVEDVTSVTTKKTHQFYNAFGTFRYQQIKQDCFTGFIQIKDESNLPCFIAEPEKAVVDFLYLNLARFAANDPAIFEESFRFQKYADLQKGKLEMFARHFNNCKLIKIVESFCLFISE